MGKTYSTVDTYYDSLIDFAKESGGRFVSTKKVLKIWKRKFFL